MPKQSQFVSSSLKRSVLNAAERILGGAPLASSRDELGDVKLSHESEAFMQNAASNIGPEVRAAAMAFHKDFLAAQEENADLDDEFEAEELAPRDVGTSVVANAEEASFVIGSSALVVPHTRNTDLSVPESRNWHSFTALATSPQHQAFIRQNAAPIFGNFPCFKEIMKTAGPMAADSMKVALHIKPSPAARGVNGAVNGALLANPVIRQQVQRSRSEVEMDRIGNWIRANGVALGANEMRFPAPFPGYSPRVIFAVSEDESFLLVEENMGVGCYSFDAPTGVFAGSLYDGQRVTQGDTLFTFALKNGEMTADEISNVNLNHVFTDGGETMAIVATGDQEFSVTYAGATPMTDGEAFEVDVAPTSADPATAKFIRLFKDKLKPQGMLDAGRPGSAPLNASYVYAWEGGRQFYANNIDKMNDVIKFMSASKAIEISFENMAPATLAAPTVADMPMAPIVTEDAREPVEVAPAVEAPPAVDEAPEPPARKAPTVDPVTQPPAREKVVKSHSVKPLNVLRSPDMGFKLGRHKDSFSDKVVSLLYREDGSGYQVVVPADGKVITFAKSFTIERRANLDEPSDSPLGSLNNGMTVNEVAEAIASAFQGPETPSPK